MIDTSNACKLNSPVTRLTEKDPLSSVYKKSLVAYMLIITALLLWPFDFVFIAKKNHARWMENSAGIEFSQEGQVISHSSTENLYNRLLTGGGLSLEAWIESQNEVQGGPARIVSYSLNPGLRNFTLGQQQRKLVMRLRTTETDLNGVYPSLQVDDIFNSPGLQQIVVTYDFSKQSVYVNGERRLQKDIPGGIFTNWDPSYYLVLGNEATGDRPWLGKIFLIAIYDEPLNETEIRQNYVAGCFPESISEKGARPVSKGLVACYLLNEGGGNIVRDSSGAKNPLDLGIPTIIQTYKRPYLAFSKSSFSQKPNFYKDTFSNIIAFILLGFLFHGALRTPYRSSLKTSTFVFLLGAIFSFCVESSQHFSLTRTSSTFDIFSNVLGTASGIAVHRSYIRYLKYRGKLLQDNVAN